MVENSASPTIAQSNDSDATTGSSRQGIVAAGGVLGAIAATSCCILPLVLSLLGLGGAWMVNLRALAPLQPYFIAATLGLLAYGFYLAYWKPKVICANGSACAAPASARLTKGLLWLASLIVFSAISFPLWFPLILPLLP